MALNRPTLQQLIDRVKADFESKLSAFGKIIPNTFVWVIARVLSGLVHGIYGLLDFIVRQVFPDTAEGEFLRRWGSIWGITQTPASFAQGQMTATGTNGSTISEGSILTRPDGVQFRVLSEATISGGTAILGVRAVVAGTEGNTDAGVSLSFASPILGVDTQGLVTSEIAGGSDEELLEAYRSRILARIQNPPLGGAASDYEQWALEVAGVTRAWPKPLYLGEGTVGLFFVKDNQDPIFPIESEVEAVSAYIDERRPVTAKHFVFAPTGDPIDFTIQLSPDTSTVQENVEEQLRDLIFRDGEPGGTILLSRMNEAISIAQGEQDHVLVAPTANFTSADGFLPTLGNVNFV